MCWCVCLVLSAPVVVYAEKHHIAEYYEVSAEVRADGSLDVEEEVRFRFLGDEYTYVNRVIPADFTDGVEILGASMDGQDLLWGDEQGQIDVDYRRSEVRLRWRFAPTVDRVHAFGLRYRMKGVVRKGVGQDWVAWAPFPKKFDYPIVQGAVFLRWEPGMQLRRPAYADGPTIAFAPIEDGVALNVKDFRERDEDIVITAQFMDGAFLGAEPQWQRDEARASEMAPAFIAGACMIAAATILALWIFYLKYRRERPDPLPPGFVMSERPEALAPAVAGAISHGRVGITGAQALATVFDLAGRGAISIEEQRATGLIKTPRFVVRRGGEHALAPHETVILDALFAGKEPRLDKAIRTLAGKPGRFKKAIEQELTALGYLDAERADGAKGLMIAGGCVMAFSLILLIVLVATNLRMGDASLLVPAALFGSGLTMMIAGGSFSTLSARGWRAATRWKAYRRHLKSLAREHRLPSNADEVSRLLPYATSLGVAPSWLKALKGMPDTAVPTWLATLGDTRTNAAFVALLASSVTSHGYGSGAGSSGVAGGGASSAG